MSEKELLHTLVDKIPDTKIVDVINYLMFIQYSQQNNNEFTDLLSAAESTLDFWNNKEDEVWDNV